MITIHLHDLIFHSFHGLHEEERIWGNEYEVNADIQFHEHGIIESIGGTIDYVDVFDIIKKRMDIPTRLLESIAMQIGSDIHESYPQVRYIHITIHKKHPPVEGMQGSVGVTWHKEF